jgi:hypothetical protein
MIEHETALHRNGCEIFRCTPGRVRVKFVASFKIRRITAINPYHPVSPGIELPARQIAKKQLATNSWQLAKVAKKQKISARRATQ